MKTTNWTPEELAEFTKQRAWANRDAWERDEKGHAILVPRGREFGWEGHDCPMYEHCSLCVDEARDTGAAICTGLTLMGIAIRELVLCRNCGAWEGRYGNCQCENDE